MGLTTEGSHFIILSVYKKFIFAIKNICLVNLFSKTGVTGGSTRKLRLAGRIFPT